LTENAVKLFKALSQCTSLVSFVFYYFGGLEREKLGNDWLELSPQLLRAEKIQCDCACAEMTDENFSSLHTLVSSGSLTDLELFCPDWGPSQRSRAATALCFPESKLKRLRLVEEDNGGILYSEFNRPMFLRMNECALVKLELDNICPSDVDCVSYYIAYTTSLETLLLSSFFDQPVRDPPLPDHCSSILLSLAINTTITRFRFECDVMLAPWDACASLFQRNTTLTSLNLRFPLEIPAEFHTIRTLPSALMCNKTLRILEIENAGMIWALIEGDAYTFPHFPENSSGDFRKTVQMNDAARKTQGPAWNRFIRAQGQLTTLLKSSLETPSFKDALLKNKLHREAWIRVSILIRFVRANRSLKSSILALIQGTSFHLSIGQFMRRADSNPPQIKLDKLFDTRYFRTETNNNKRPRSLVE